MEVWKCVSGAVWRGLHVCLGWGDYVNWCRFFLVLFLSDLIATGFSCDQHLSTTRCLCFNLIVQDVKILKNKKTYNT